MEMSGEGQGAVKIWGPWSERACSVCGAMGYATRGEARPAYEYLCEGCEGAQQAHADRDAEVEGLKTQLADLEAENERLQTLVDAYERQRVRMNDELELVRKDRAAKTLALARVHAVKDRRWPAMGRGGDRLLIALSAALEPAEDGEVDRGE